MITGVDGHRVLEPQDVSEAVNVRKPGDGMDLEVSRGGERRTLGVYSRFSIDWMILVVQ